MSLDREMSWVASLATALAAAHTDATVLDAVRQAVARRGLTVSVDPGRGGESLHRVTVPLDEGEATLTLEGRDARWRASTAAAFDALVVGAFGHARAIARVATHARRALEERARLSAALDASRDDDALVARSALMRALVDDAIPLVAAQEVPVLLRGESGTGKEVLARRLHALSPRRRRAYVRINCAAIPETLAASALFGHERGAFTGAHARHAGVFERAHGGTLLLDEVGDLSPAVQAQLLRALQEGEIERVGGSEVIRVDVRVIAATHQPLEQRVREGRFRADLLYRLAVVPLWVPPLRDRLDDLEDLARALLRRHARRLKRAIPVLDAADLAWLRAQPWPGNVRELENTLLRAMVLSGGGRLALRTPAADPVAHRPAPSPTRSFADAQRDAIADALRESGGRIYGAAGAAARLGMKPTTLRSAMDRLGLTRRPATRSAGDDAAGRAAKP